MIAKKYTVIVESCLFCKYSTGEPLCCSLAKKMLNDVKQWAFPEWCPLDDEYI